MDGNLLDPENADATLAKEWNLPELPAGVEGNLLLTLITRHDSSPISVLFYLKRTTVHNEKLGVRRAISHMGGALCHEHMQRLINSLLVFNNSLHHSTKRCS